MCVCFAAAAVPVLHLFLSHQSGVDGLQALHGPTPRHWQSDPACPLSCTHTHTRTHYVIICIYSQASIHPKLLSDIQTMKGKSKYIIEISLFLLPQLYYFQMAYSSFNHISKRHLLTSYSHLLTNFIYLPHSLLSLVNL